MAENGFFSDFLEDMPEAAYYSAAPFGAGVSAASPFGRDYWQTDPSTQAERAPSQTFVEAGGYAPAAQRYWSGQYGNVMNQYMGTVGKSLREGEFPSLTFTDYLGQYPWTERYTALSPAMRQGGGISRFAPSVRRMY